MCVYVYMYVVCVFRCRREYELQVESKKAELAEWEARLQVEQGRQSAVQAELRQARQQVREERQRREEVESSLHDTTKRMVELQRQKEESCKALEKVVHAHTCIYMYCTIYSACSNNKLSQQFFFL